MRPPSGDILENEYRLRISRVIDYIHGHYGEDLNLEKLAKMAGMSKFHFHRIFKSIAREPAGDFIRRVRVKQAMHKLVSDAHKSLTDIALECGFSSSQNFAKMFKAYLGATPSLIREEYNWQNWCRKIQSLKTKKREDLEAAEANFYDLYCKKMPLDDILEKTAIPDVQIKQLPDRQVAYIRSIGGEDKRTLVLSNFKKLLDWASPRGFCKEDMCLLRMIPSNPDITPEENMMVDACITVPASVKGDNWVNVQTIPGGVYAVCRREVFYGKFLEVLFDIMINWLTSSSYLLDDRPLFVIYRENPQMERRDSQILDIHLPIKPVYD